MSSCIENDLALLAKDSHLSNPSWDNPDDIFRVISSDLTLSDSPETQKTYNCFHRMSSTTNDKHTDQWSAALIWVYIRGSFPLHDHWLEIKVYLRFTTRWYCKIFYFLLTFNMLSLWADRIVIIVSSSLWVNVYVLTHTLYYCIYILHFTVHWCWADCFVFSTWIFSTVFIWRISVSCSCTIVEWNSTLIQYIFCVWPFRPE